jgi:hypothetical protein
MRERPGLWQKLFGREKAEAQLVSAARPGHSMTGRVVTGIEPDWSRYDDCMKMQVVGESFYQPALKQVSRCPKTGPHGFECSAELVPEPENPHDKFAVKVMVQGRQVGHLGRGNARRYHKRIRALNDEGKRVICMAYIGRAEGGLLGMNLRIPYGGDLLREKKR